MTSHRKPWQRLACWAAALAVATGLACPKAAAQKVPTQYEVEAAYLFRFSKFLRAPLNPEARTSTFDICVLGESPFGPALKQITANETVDDRPVRVVALEKSTDARTCSILFVSTSETAKLEEDFAALHGADVLTVGDMPRFLDRGGMIQFVRDQDRVRFSINLDAVSQTRLSLSSELLRVATSVHGKPRPEGTP